MPTLSPSHINVVATVLGTFTIMFGIVSVKIKNTLYLGEALPAMLVGIALGPVSAKFLDSHDWGSNNPDNQSAITLGVTRIVICLQLVIAGYQLPAKYIYHRRKEVFICLIPIMTLMWLLTTACFLATIPKVTLLASMAIAAAVTCTDPVLSQAVAKGPFSDKYVARPLREIISTEACLNDGFGFPFLMLAVYLMRHADTAPFDPEAGTEGALNRLGGGLGDAMKYWFLETWLYTVLLSAVYGFLVGFAACKGIKFGLKRKWIDTESYSLFPVAIGLFILGTAGCLGTNDLLACAVAGCALNWDGEFLEETERRNDEVNTCIDVLLNFVGFIYIGTIIPWSKFQDPDGTGITIWRLFLLGFMVLFLRRIPAVMVAYRFMPSVVSNWKEALFMGYFGPIGIGAVFYVEYTRTVVPKEGESDVEMENLIRALPATLYFLVLFSITIHGISIPILNYIYQYYNVEPIKKDAVTIRRKSLLMPTPTNATTRDSDTFIAFNRFRRPTDEFLLGVLPTQQDERINGVNEPRLPDQLHGERSSSWKLGARSFFWSFRREK